MDLRAVRRFCRVIAETRLPPGTAAFAARIAYDRKGRFVRDE